MSVQIIKTPNGEELVVLPRAEYEALIAARDHADELEDAADVAMYDAIKAGFAEGDDVALPEKVSDYLLGGDSRLRAIRRWRGLSQVELAERAGIGQSYLSEIESRRKVGADDTIRAIAGALEVPVAWIA